MSEIKPPENGSGPGSDDSRAWGILLFVILFQVVYFVLAFRQERLFIFEDDFIRLTYARYALGHLFAIHPWGEWGWLPAMTLIQGLAAAALPFGLVANVLLLNLAFVTGSIVLIERLAVRIAPGPERMVGPALFGLSPITAWLATSALSEPATIFLLLLQCWLLVLYVETRHLLAFVGAVLAATVAMLIRFESWFVNPALLVLAVMLKAREDRSRAGLLALIALPSLAAPLSWMAGQWIRFGDPLHTLNKMARIHEPLNLRLSAAEVTGVMVEACSHVALPAWVLLVLGAIMSVAWLARGGWRQAWAWTPPGALFPLLAFLLLLFLFVYSVATFRWGFPVHRFVLTWMAPAFPLLCVPLLYGGRRLAWACLWVVLIVSIAGFALVDRQRPDVYESHGVLAWKEVEAEVRADRREPNAQIIIPEGQAEYAAASATVFAPSVSYDIIPVQDGAFLPAIKRSDAAFVVIHRRNFPGMEQLSSHEVFYRDGHYVVLVPRGAGP